MYNPAKRKGVCPKLESRWEGPYLVFNKLSDVVFRVQRNKKAKKKVIHYDRLKVYEGEPLKDWNQANEPRVIDERVETTPIINHIDTGIMPEFNESNIDLVENVPND